MAVSATVAMYTGRSSQPRPRSGLLSQQTARSGTKFPLSTFLRLWLKLNRLFNQLGLKFYQIRKNAIIQPTGSQILSNKKKMQGRQPGSVIHLNSPSHTGFLEYFHILYTITFLTKRYGMLNA